MPSSKRLARRVVALALLVVALSATAMPAPTTAQAVAKCNTKTKAPTVAPTPTTAAPTDDDEYDDGDDETGADDDTSVVTPTPTSKTPKPTSKTPKPTSKTPKTTKPSKTPTTSTPSVTTSKPSAANEAGATNGTAVTTKPTAAGGKCVTGDPTQYISKAYVDWIWEKRMKPHFNFNNFIFDQLMTNNGKLSYCVRWDSTNKLPKATAAKFQKMLERQYAQWNKWLTGYGCWPFETIEIEMVGVAVRDKALLDWSDDSLGTIYEKELDDDGIPRCPDACYKHRNFEAKSDTSACKGKPFDISLWPTLGQGGGAGGDWGQRVDEANMLSTVDADSSVIVAHEIGHGFGLPDFYEPSDKPGADMPKLIMEAGASMSVTEGDGWLIRRAWEYVRTRYPSTSG